MFEQEYDVFLKEQIRGADGQRLEMLQRDLTGTKKLLEKALHMQRRLQGIDSHSSEHERAR